MNKDEIAGLRGLSDDALQKVSNAFDYGETLNVASMRQIVEILADELEVTINQPDCDGDFEGDVWFGHPEKRTLGTHIWRAGLWHELPTELDAVISLLGQARSQRDTNADALTTLSARVETLEAALRWIGNTSEEEIPLEYNDAMRKTFQRHVRDACRQALAGDTNHG